MQQIKNVPCGAFFIFVNELKKTMLVRHLYIALIMLFASLLSCSSNAQQTDIPVDEFDSVIKKHPVQVLDVRTATEYKNGHLPKALQANWNDEVEFKKRVQALDKKIPVYTYCMVGARSAAATKWLNENGYTAFNMQGGINKWKGAGKLLEQQTFLKQLTMDEYLQKIPADKTVLVDFGAEWCPPCKKMDVVINELQQTHAGKFTLIKIDGGIHTNLTKALSVEELPSFFIYKNGNITWKAQGILSAEEITQHL